MPSEPIDSFRTHSNYIQAFRLLIHNPLSPPRGNKYAALRQRILGGNVLPQPSAVAIDIGQLRTSLCAAWATDALLSMTCRFIDDEELLRLSNNWSAIQVYYIFYHATQALHIAKGQPRPESHPKTQNIFYDNWIARPTDLPPWSCGFGADGLKNAPQGITVDIGVQPWTACIGENIWNLAFKSLMTTRRSCLKEKYHEQRENKKRVLRQEWRRNEDARIARGRLPRPEPPFPLPTLSTQEKQRINDRLRPFTLMDYLYRIRIKANYDDASMFSDGPEDASASRNIRNAFCIIAGGTLFLHELAIRNLVGLGVFLRWADEWIQRNIPNDPTYGLGARRPYLD